MVTNTTHSSTIHQCEFTNLFPVIAVCHTCYCSQVNSSLKQLQLAWNGFGHMEAEALGQALKKNSTLQLLDISSNNIDDEGVTLFCQGLATNNTLRVLKVSRQKGESLSAVIIILYLIIIKGIFALRNCRLIHAKCTVWCVYTFI